MLYRRLKLVLLLAIILGLISGSSLNKKSPEEHILSKREISLNTRQPDRFVNDVFKRNILLTLAYMNDQVSKRESINWDDIKKPRTYEIKLNSNETFAFHEDVLPEYKEKIVKTTKARFNYTDGFVTDGYLYGDGVCHLASLIYWTAKDAGLLTKAPTNHNFAKISEIPKEFGVSIYYLPGNRNGNAIQNLYITNNFKEPIVFRFDYENDKLKLAIIKETT